MSGDVTQPSYNRTACLAFISHRCDARGAAGIALVRDERKCFMAAQPGTLFRVRDVVTLVRHRRFPAGL